MSEFTSLSDIVTIFHNSAQPTFVRYHIIRSVLCFGCPKAKSRYPTFVRYHYRLYLAVVAPKQSTVLSDFCSLPPSPAVLLWLPQSKVPFNLLISCFSMDPNGFAFLHNGTIFYSPNSNRHVAVPQGIARVTRRFSISLNQYVNSCEFSENFKPKIMQIRSEMTELCLQQILDTYLQN